MLKIDILIEKGKVKQRNGFEYNLTPKWFNLYCYLSLERIENELKADGYVDRDRIRSLPYWGTASSDSIGKEISRHIAEMEKTGKNILEAPARQRTVGPYRIILKASDIRFDVEFERVRAFLKLDDIIPFFPTGKHGKTPYTDLYSYVDKVCAGQQYYEQGEMKKALPFYQNALGFVYSTEQRIFLLCQIAQILRQLDRYDEALKKLDKALKLLDESKSENYLARAEIYLEKGIVRYFQEDRESAKELYHRARNIIGKREHYRILGNIYNYLALVYKREKKYNDALICFKQALDFWCRDHYFYGIQAVYANIGDLCLYLWQINKDAKYLWDAIRWSDMSIEISQNYKVGRDSVFAYIVKSSAYRELAYFDEAIEAAQEGIKRAKIIGIERELAYCYLVLGMVYRMQAISSERKGAKEEAVTYYQRAILEVQKGIDINITLGRENAVKGMESRLNDVKRKLEAL